MGTERVGSKGSYRKEALGTGDDALLLPPREFKSNVFHKYEELDIHPHVPGQQLQVVGIVGIRLQKRFFFCFLTAAGASFFS